MSLCLIEERSLDWKTSEFQVAWENARVEDAAECSYF